jgi:hypothetical protein
MFASKQEPAAFGSTPDSSGLCTAPVWAVLLTYTCATNHQFYPPRTPEPAAGALRHAHSLHPRRGPCVQGSGRPAYSRPLKKDIQ